MSIPPIPRSFQRLAIIILIGALVVQAVFTFSVVRNGVPITSWDVLKSLWVFPMVVAVLINYAIGLTRSERQKADKIKQDIDKMTQASRTRRSSDSFKINRKPPIQPIDQYDKVKK